MWFIPSLIYFSLHFRIFQNLFMILWKQTYYITCTFLIFCVCVQEKEIVFQNLTYVLEIPHIFWGSSRYSDQAALPTIISQYVVRLIGELICWKKKINHQFTFYLLPQLIDWQDAWDFE